MGRKYKNSNINIIIANKIIMIKSKNNHQSSKVNIGRNKG